MAHLTALKKIASTRVLTNVWSTMSRPLSTVMSSCGLHKFSNTSSLPILCSQQLLVPPPPAFVTPCAGMKVAGKLRKRCDNCFFIMINERLHIWCDVHPRHKQMQMVTKPKNLMRVCSVSQHKIRPW